MFAEEGNRACELGAGDKQLHYSRQLVDKSMSGFGIRIGKCVDRITVVLCVAITIQFC